MKKAEEVKRAWTALYAVLDKELLPTLDTVSDHYMELEEDLEEALHNLSELRAAMLRSQELAHALGDLLHEIGTLPLPSDAKFHLRMAFSAAGKIAPGSLS